jgi:hypothetical protein
VVFNKIKYRPEEALISSGETLVQGIIFNTMNDRKSNNDTLIITKSHVMVFYEFIGDRYDVIAPHSETYILETF